MPSVKKELASGVFYTALSKYAGIAVSVGISAILARLISPSDFGVVAIATVIITFFGIFSDLGIGPAIIQNKSLSKEDLNNIFTFTVYLGLFISLLFFLFSTQIAAYYQKPVLVTICRVLSVNLFFASVNIVPDNLLFKAKRFKFVAFRTLGVNAVGGILSALAAWKGMGVYALLINPVFSSAGLFLINYLQYPARFRGKIDFSSLKTIASFSVYQFLFNFINYFARNLDKLTIGKYLGMAPLGYYDKSYRLMMLPLQNITFVVAPVMLPVFSDFQNDLEKLSSSYLKVIRFLAFIGFPLSALLYFVAHDVILFIYGSNWLPSVPVFKILSLSVGIQIVLSTSGSIFQAVNRTKEMFISGLLSALVILAGLFVSIFFFRKLEAVAFALVISFAFNFFQSYWVLFCRIFRKSLFVLLRELYSPLILSIIIALLLYFTNSFIGSFVLIVRLIIQFALFTLLFVCYVFLTKETAFTNLLKLKSFRILSRGEKKE